MYPLTSKILSERDTARYMPNLESGPSSSFGNPS